MTSPPSRPTARPRADDDALAAAIEATGRYAPMAVLGRGGMGEVWRVMDLRLGRQVALKVVRPDRAGDALDLRLREEAQATAQLEHPAIVPVHELGALPGGIAYYTMREVSGETFTARLGTWRSALDPTEHRLRAVEVIRQAAEAVGLAHARGVLHRDLKPDNILVGERGEVYVLDWGLVKVLGGPEAAVSARVRPVISAQSVAGAALTHTGQAMGTPGYRSPEQEHAQSALGPPSDVFALGAVLYTALTGRVPSALVRTNAAQWAREAARAGRVPQSLAAIVRRCMEADPQARYPDASAVAEALGRWLSGARQTAQREALTRDAEGAFLALPEALQPVAVWLLGALLNEDGEPTAAALPRAGGARAVEEASAALEGAAVVQRDDARWALLDPTLVAAWPRLAQLAADRDGRRAQTTLTRATARLAEGGALKDALLQGDDLTHARAWRDRARPWLPPEAARILDASTHAAEASRRRAARLRRGGVAALVVVLVAFAALWLRAEDARRAAQAGQFEANAGRAIAEAKPFSAIALYRASQALAPLAIPEDFERAAARDVTHRRVHIGGGILWRVAWSPDDATLAVSRADGGLTLLDPSTGHSRTAALFASWAEWPVWIDAQHVTVRSQTHQAATVRADDAAAFAQSPPGATVLDVRPSDGARLVWHDARLRIAPASPSTATPDRADLAQPTPPLRGALRDRVAVVLGQDTRLRLLDPQTGAARAALDPLKDAARLLLSPSGDRALVTDHTAEQAWLVDTAQGRVVADLTATHGAGWLPFSCGWTPDSALLACGSREGHTRLIDAHTGALRWSAQPTRLPIWTTRISPDGLRVASGGSEGVIRIRDAATGTHIETLYEHGADVKWLDWSHDSQRLATALANGAVVVWTPQSRRLLPTPRCPAPWAHLHQLKSLGDGRALLLDRAKRGCVLRRDGTTTATRDFAPALFVWPNPNDDSAHRLVSGDQVFTLDADGQTRPLEALPFRAASWRAAGARVWAVRADDGALMTRAGGGPWRALEGDAHRGRLRIAPRHDRIVAYTPSDDLLTLRDATTGAKLRAWGSHYFHTTDGSSWALDDDRGLLYTAGPDGTLYRWSLRDGAGGEVQTRPGSGSRSLAVVGEGRWVLSSSRSGVSEAWRADDLARAVWSKQLKSAPYAPHMLRDDVVRIAAYGGAGAVGLETGTLHLWNPDMTAFSVSKGAPDHALATFNDARHKRLLWSLHALPQTPLADAGARTNLRVCQDTGAVVPVVPYPPPEQVWAPERACRSAQPP